jgi:hypothetical protein
MYVLVWNFGALNYGLLVQLSFVGPHVLHIGKVLRDGSMRVSMIGIYIKLYH